LRKDTTSELASLIFMYRPFCTVPLMLNVKPEGLEYPILKFL